MVRKADFLNRFDEVNILVIGDILLDVYTKGKVERISPEAPVPILHVKDLTHRPGGAGNVALNLKTLGANVDLIGIVGNDQEGESLISELESAGIPKEGFFVQANAKTSLKNRFIAEGQQLIRVDYEEVLPLTSDLEIEIAERISQSISQYQLIAISDYGKGLLTESLLKHIIQKAKSSNIPVLVDPKGRDFSKYSGAYLIKPNMKEAYEAAGFDQSEKVEVVANKIFENVDVKYLLITRSEKGMTLFERGAKEREFPVHRRDVLDVTGAGDTTLAMIAFSIANGLDFDECILLANVAASIAIEEVGCAAVKMSQVVDRMLSGSIDEKISVDIS